MENDILKRKEDTQSCIKSLEISLNLPIEKPRDVSGIIKDFELAYESAWRYLRSALEAKGIETHGPKVVFKLAKEHRLILNIDVWTEMAKDRNRTVRSFNENFFNEVIASIKRDYLSALKKIG